MQLAYCHGDTHKFNSSDWHYAKSTNPTAILFGFVQNYFQSEELLLIPKPIGTFSSGYFFPKKMHNRGKIYLYQWAVQPHEIGTILRENRCFGISQVVLIRGNTLDQYYFTTDTYYFPLIFLQLEEFPPPQASDVSLVNFLSWSNSYIDCYRLSQFNAKQIFFYEHDLKCTWFGNCNQNWLGLQKNETFRNHFLCTLDHETWGIERLHCCSLI